MTTLSDGNPGFSKSDDPLAVAAEAMKAVWVTPTVTELDVACSNVAAATSSDADALS